MVLRGNSNWGPLGMSMLLFSCHPTRTEPNQWGDRTCGKGCVQRASTPQKRRASCLFEKMGRCILQRSSTASNQVSGAPIVGWYQPSLPRAHRNKPTTWRKFGCSGSWPHLQCPHLGHQSDGEIGHWQLLFWTQQLTLSSLWTMLLCPEHIQTSPKSTSLIEIEQSLEVTLITKGPSSSTGSNRTCQSGFPNGPVLMQRKVYHQSIIQYHASEPTWKRVSVNELVAHLHINCISILDRVSPDCSWPRAPLENHVVSIVGRKAEISYSWKPSQNGISILLEILVRIEIFSLTALPKRRMQAYW
jgi:hypothetical protein